MAIDDKVTVAIERNSSQVGRLQGIYVNSELDGTDLHLLVSLVFTNKAYNGSTLKYKEQTGSTKSIGRYQ